MIKAKQAFFTPPQLAQIFGSSPRTILAYIESGELRAVDQNFGGDVPRWKVSSDDWQAFLDRRSNQTAVRPDAKEQQTRKLNRRALDAAARQFDLG